MVLIASGRTDWIPQDRSRASFFHKRAVEDSRIDWTWPARDIANLVRAQSDPYPNAFTGTGQVVDFAAYAAAVAPITGTRTGQEAQ